MRRGTEVLRARTARCRRNAGVGRAIRVHCCTNMSPTPWPGTVVTRARLRSRRMRTDIWSRNAPTTASRRIVPSKTRLFVVCMSLSMGIPAPSTLVSAPLARQCSKEHLCDDSYNIKLCFDRETSPSSTTIVPRQNRFKLRFSLISARSEVNTF